jgi:hypothetical protein
LRHFPGVWRSAAVDTKKMIGLTREKVLFFSDVRDLKMTGPSASLLYQVRRFRMPWMHLSVGRKVRQVQLHFEMQMLYISKIHAVRFFPCVDS